MANRNLRRDVAAVETNVVFTGGQVTLSPSALTGTTANTIPHCSASMVSAGHYRLQWQDSFKAIRDVQFTLENTGSQVLYLVGSGSSTGTGANSTSAARYDFLLCTGSSGLKTIPGNEVIVHFHGALKNGV